MNSVIHVTVLYFAAIREITRLKREMLELSNKALVKDLLTEIVGRYPKLSQVKHFKISVNCNIVSHNTLLKDGDEVALLPPISGG